MKHTRSILTLIALTLSICATAAMKQDDRRDVLGIGKVTYVSPFKADDARVLRNQIISAIQKTGRVSILDIADTTNAGKPVSAVLTASLDQLTITNEIYEDKETKKVGDSYKTFVKGKYPYVKAVMKYTVKIVSNEGSILFQESHSHTVGSYNMDEKKPDYKDANAAHKGVMSSCVNPDHMTVMILNTFKVEGKIVQVDKSNGKKAQSVYVSLGADDGIRLKQMFEVYEEFDIAGEVSQRYIGKVEIDEIMGLKRSHAKVKEGGDKILETLNKGGNLPVRSCDVKDHIFGGIR